MRSGKVQTKNPILTDLQTLALYLNSKSTELAETDLGAMANSSKGLAMEDTKLAFQIPK